MTFDSTKLLPSSAGPFERSVLSGFGVDGDLPVPIKQVLDAAQTPQNFLPWLAAHESVDLWFSDWTDDRKREVIANAFTDGWLKGTRAGAIRFLGYVDATLIDVIAYPTPFVFGRAIIGQTPYGLAPFTANYLIRVDTYAPRRCFIMGRAAVSYAPVVTPPTTPWDRALMALRVTDAPETQIRVDFQHKRIIGITDAVPLDGSYVLGQWIERTKL